MFLMDLASELTWANSVVWQYGNFILFLFLLVLKFVLGASFVWFVCYNGETTKKLEMNSHQINFNSICAVEGIGHSLFSL